MEAGHVQGNYKFLELIGVGGQGKVFKALDMRLKRLVAIKVISKEGRNRRNRMGGFLHEARVASALNHPNICTVYALDEDHDHAYMVMEYVEGKNAFELAYKRPLEIESAIGIVLQVTDALIAAHGQGIIHRDIKPRNVMVTPSGQVRVLDFGLAKLMEDDEGIIEMGSEQAPTDAEEGPTGETAHRIGVTIEGVAQGTPSSSPPEMVLGKPTDQRSDVFSTGIILYLLLTGEYAFRAKTNAEVRNKVLNEDYIPVSVARRSGGPIPLSLAAIVTKAFRKDPDERFQTVYEMQEALLAVLRKLSDGGQGKDRSGYPVFLEGGELRYAAAAGWKSSHKAGLAALIAAIAALGVGLIWYFF